MIVAAAVLTVNGNHVSAAAVSVPFIDISDSFAKKQIIDLYNKKMISGTTGRTFEPKKPITRAEFMAMSIRILRLQPVANDIPTYSDVAGNAWYYGAVEAASNLQLTQGKGSQRLKPLDQITRQEAAVILMRMLKQQTDGRLSDGTQYHDQELIAAWASAEVRHISSLGLMTGNNERFRPQDVITREETAAVLDRILLEPRWSAEMKKPHPAGIQLGWQYASTTVQFIQQVSKSSINTLSPRYHFLQKDGSVSDGTDPALISWASAHGKKVWSMLGNRSDAEVTHIFLSDERMRAAAILQLSGFVEKYRLHGINVDFENVKPEDRANFTAFINELALEMHRVGAMLSVNVSPDQGTSWTRAFDYRAIGRSADYVVLMGYDEHWGGAPEAGSVSSLPWIERATDKLLQNVPSNKIILALPFYSREWVADTGAYAGDISLIRQGEIARNFTAKKEWNAAVGQYILDYTKQGVKHRIWAEDSRSLTLKYEMAISRGVTGFAYWYMGAETEDIWTSIHNAGKYASYHFS